VACNTDSCRQCADLDTTLDVVALASARGPGDGGPVRWDATSEHHPAGWLIYSEVAKKKPPCRIGVFSVSDFAEGRASSCSASLDCSDDGEEANPSADFASLGYLPGGYGFDESTIGFGKVKREEDGQSMCCTGRSEALRKITTQFGLPSASNDVIGPRTARGLDPRCDGGCGGRAFRPAAPLGPLPPPLGGELSTTASRDATSSRLETEEASTQASRSPAPQVARTLLQARLPLRLDELTAPHRKLGKFAAANHGDDDESTPSSSSTSPELHLDLQQQLHEVMCVAHETRASKVREQLRLPLDRLQHKAGDAGEVTSVPSNKDTCNTKSTTAQEVYDPVAKACKQREQEIINAVRYEREARERVRLFLAQHGFRGACSKKKGLLSYSYPLHVAVNQGDSSMVRALLKAGADPQQQDSSGRTPKQLAVNRDDGLSRQDMIEALSEAEAAAIAAAAAVAAAPGGGKTPAGQAAKALRAGGVSRWSVAARRV